MDVGNKKSLKLVYGDFTLGVHGNDAKNDFHYIFSYAAGGLESIVKNGIEWLYRCPKPTFWQALTDNDRGSKFHVKSGSWLAADLFTDCKNVEVFVDRIPYGIPCAPRNNKFESNVYADEVCICFTYETVTNPKTLVDIIYEVKKNGQIDDISLTPYLVPQECGMRMDTDWVEIYRGACLDNSKTDDTVHTLRIQKRESKFSFSCLPYTASEIETATHHEELPPARRTVLCIYGAVRGIGGIDSWGSDVEESYHISGEKDIRYSFTLL